jgi:hypothetical protein
MYNSVYAPCVHTLMCSLNKCFFSPRILWFFSPKELGIFFFQSVNLTIFLFFGEKIAEFSYCKKDLEIHYLAPQNWLLFNKILQWNLHCFILQRKVPLTLRSELSNDCDSVIFFDDPFMGPPSAQYGKSKHHSYVSAKTKFEHKIIQNLHR